MTPKMSIIGLPPTKTVKAISAQGRYSPSKRNPTIKTQKVTLRYEYHALEYTPRTPNCDRCGRVATAPDVDDHEDERRAQEGDAHEERDHPEHCRAEEEHEGVVSRGATAARERILLQPRRVVGQDHELHEEGEAEAPEEHEARGEAPELEALPHEVEVQVQRLRVQQPQRAQ